MNGLFWFRHDLRLHDNAALLTVAAQAQRLLCVYVVDPAWLRPTLQQSKPLGAIRWRFIRESLHDLQQQLAAFGQTLVIRVGQPEVVIAQLIAAHDIHTVGVTHVPATYERRAVDHLQKTHRQQQWVVGDSFTLFSEAQLPFPVSDLPGSFTPFRQRVEDLPLLPPAPRPTQLPAPLVCGSDALPDLPLPAHSPHALPFVGGESAGLAQLHTYLHGTKNVSHYKETRNGLDGWDFSSKFSPWLALGNI